MTTAQEEFEECLDLARQLLSGSDEVADLWEANELCNRALRLMPKNGVAWLVKTQVLLQLDDAVAAYAAVQMTLRRLPRNPEAHYLHAAALSQMGRYPDALMGLQRAFEYARVGTDDSSLMEELYYEKAAILSAMDKNDDAISALESGLSLFPESELLRQGLLPLRQQKLRQSWRVLDGGLRSATRPR